MNVVFLLSTLTQPRYRKRIAGLRAEGVRPRILGFERDYVPGPGPGPELEVLGRIPHGRYLRRALTLAPAVRRIRRAARDAAAIYAFGTDMAALAALATAGRNPRPRLVYEIGDVRELLLASGTAGRAARTLDRRLVRRADVVVVTSQAYASAYLDPLLGARHPGLIAIENKLDRKSLLDRGRTPRILDVAAAHGPIRIGYFGLLRCPRSWAVLRELALRSPTGHRVVLRGLPFGIPDLERDATALDNVEFGGPYRSPDDLPDLYGSVDLVWACYPWSEGARGNASMARTNRFYEACYFGRPMITLAGTEDARAVEEAGIGTAVDLSDIDRAAQAIAAIDRSDIEAWRQAVERLPEPTYLLTDEHARLASALARDDAEAAGGVR